MADFRPVIVGSGPAGLAAAHELSRRGIHCQVLEKDRQVGGLCKTVAYRGFRCDLGGHRFYTKNQEVQSLWEETLPDDFLVRPRLSRIYYRRKFFHYPLKATNALAGLGFSDSIYILFSYFKSQVLPVRPEVSFEDWVSNRFGKALYNIFFKTYTEKIWGTPCTALSADLAAQRIRNLSLGRALLNALGLQKNKGKVASLIDRFHYPRLGPGQMYETLAGRVEQGGGRLVLKREVTEIHHQPGRITSIQTNNDAGQNMPVSHCFSSMPITELVLRLRPSAPDAVLAAAHSLRYRSFVTVNLLFRRPTPLPDNWIYLHNPEVLAGRLQFYENWSRDLAPPGCSSVGFEYFCFEGDGLWSRSDQQLMQLALRDLGKLNFYPEQDFLDGFVVRYAKAYPMYEDGYEKHLKIIREWLAQFVNLYCIGRYGQFRYNDMDYSIMTGFLAVRRMLGEEVDLWSVNTEGE